MKTIYRLFTRLTITALISGSAQAQETYFNVSESDITEKHKIIVQQQFSIQSTYRSLTTFDYGLGKNWEIGANLYNLDYDPAQKMIVRNDTSTQMAYAPLLLLNAQKVFNLNDQFKIGIGAQGGLNLSPTNRSKFVGFAYSNLAGSFAKDHYKATVGLYTGHVRYLGDGPRIGFQAGFDAGIFYEKLHLMGDWISGSHEVGQSVLGLEIYLFKSLPLALGWQRSNSDGSSAVVVQLTYMPQQ